MVGRLSLTTHYSGFAIAAVGHTAPMPGRAFEIRFPNGDYEIDASGQHPPPNVGDVIRRNGELWRVMARSDDKPIRLWVEAAEEPAERISS